MNAPPKMPPRAEGLEFVPLDPADNTLTVGKVPVAGVGMRVGIMCAGELVLMSPAKARRMALDFETPEAVKNELDWVAVALRECADEIEALTATKQ